MSEETNMAAIWEKLPTKRELARQLDRVAMSADAKVLMGKLLETTMEVAGKIIEVGRRIMAFVLELFRRFPNTTFGAAIGLTLSFLISSIPLAGLVLGPLLGPILMAFTIGNGAFADMKNSAVSKQVELFGAKLDSALAND
ncbi:hypothetical protein [Sphingobium vermicomposti]|uniref:Uncharacterized protein n=1 Tax=Sphingobium vermicomposti TaxID=529005 RepID=A0A846M5K9_9SPHN|nr:hypothetical protein [Sphingobium vermicomposti]NIJ17517.1 hypothetical protein [Sphingobium vermicomposti]